jgi:hypothetical protein
MTLSAISSAQGRARTLFEKLTIAEHFEEQRQDRQAARAMEDASIWLDMTAKAMGYKLVRQPAAAAKTEAVS